MPDPCTWLRAAILLALGALIGAASVALFAL